MGVVSIPPDPSGPGRLRVQLELSPEELRVTIKLLQASLARLRPQGSTVGSTGTAARSDVRASLEQLTLGDAPPNTPAMQRPPAAAAAAPRGGPGGGGGVPPVPPAPAMPKVLYTPGPGPAPARPAPLPAPAPRPPQPAAPPPAFAAPRAAAPAPPPPPAPRAMPPPQAMAPAAVPPPPPRAPAPALVSAPPPPAARRQQWRCVCSSDPVDHNREVVYALAYCNQIDGLPGGDGHGGWLLSSSRKMLNLWECSVGGGDMASIMLMHSQETDFLSSSISVEPSLQLMFAAGCDTRAGQPPDSLTVHSLSADRGMLAYQYRMTLPNALAPKPGQGAPPAQQQRRPTVPPPKVVSLHSLGRTLRGCVAASLGPRLMLYEVNTGPSSTAQAPSPRQSWDNPNQVLVTSLHCSAASGLLLSGGMDGSVALWNVRDRSTQAIRVLRSSQPSPITAMQLLSQQCLVTGNNSGTVLLWDLRSPAAPLQALPMPGDCGAVLSMRARPSGDCLAIAAAKGLYTVELSGGAGAAMPSLPSPAHLVSGAPLRTGAAAGVGSWRDLEWNWATGELYASTDSGSISAFKRLA